jgi:hypothetical protein
MDGVVRGVVDSGRWAVRQQHIGGGQALHKCLRLLLGPLDAALPAVERGAGEAAEAERAHADAPQVHVVGAERTQGIAGIVVAEHPQLGYRDLFQSVRPGWLEIAEDDDQFGLGCLHQLGDRSRRRLVCERQDQHRVGHRLRG